MKKHLYLCGPMSGLPINNRLEFDRTAWISSEEAEDHAPYCTVLIN